MSGMNRNHATAHRQTTVHPQANFSSQPMSSMNRNLATAHRQTTVHPQANFGSQPMSSMNRSHATALKLITIPQAGTGLHVHPTSGIPSKTFVEVKPHFHQGKVVPSIHWGNR